jgi:hypothetical protein
VRTLILGGYGNFGARIGRALAGDGAVELVVAGRDPVRARAFAAGLPGPAEAVALDAGAVDLAARLRELGIGLVVHTAGPFQGQDYRVAGAAAAASAHYIDLADGRRFVCDFGAALDAPFRAAGRCAVSGASTLPALSSAVVDHLAAGWSRIEAIESCIAPAQTAPRGTATLAAVLSYCGEPIRVWQGGQWQMQRGWADPVPVRFARLAPRLGALCDVPDLEIFPARHAGVRDVTFSAALEVPLAQRAFAVLAAWRSRGWLPRPDRFAAALQRLSRVFDGFGSSLGGMAVRVRGIDAEGRPAARAWLLAADHDHGPEIPCMAAILLAQRLARGEAWPAGSQPAIGLLALEAFAPQFERWGMVIDIVDEAV